MNWIQMENMNKTLHDFNSYFLSIILPPVLLLHSWEFLLWKNSDNIICQGCDDNCCNEFGDQRYWQKLTLTFCDLKYDWLLHVHLPECAWAHQGYKMNSGVMWITAKSTERLGIYLHYSRFMHCGVFIAKEVQAFCYIQKWKNITNTLLGNRIKGKIPNWFCPYKGQNQTT